MRYYRTTCTKAEATSSSSESAIWSSTSSSSFTDSTYTPAATVTYVGSQSAHFSSSYYDTESESVFDAGGSLSSTAESALTATYSSSDSSSFAETIVTSDTSFTQTYSQSQSYSASGQTWLKTIESHNPTATTFWSSSSYGFTFSSSSTNTGEGQETVNGIWGPILTTGTSGTIYSTESSSYTFSSSTTAGATTSFSISSQSTTATSQVGTTYSTTTSSRSTTGSGYSSLSNATTYTTSASATTLSSETTSVTTTSWTAGTTQSFSNYPAIDSAWVFERENPERMFRLTTSTALAWSVLSELLSETSSTSYLPTTTIGPTMTASGTTGGPTSHTTASGATDTAFAMPLVSFGACATTIAASPAITTPYFGADSSGYTSVTYSRGVYDTTAQNLPGGGITTGRMTVYGSTESSAFYNVAMRIHGRSTISLSSSLDTTAAIPDFVFTPANLHRLGVFTFNTTSLAA